MRTCITWLLSALVGVGMLACTGGSGGGDIGGADPAEGGISEVPNPHADMAARSGKPLGQLQRGHEVYMLKCAECHAYKLPKEIDVARWAGGSLKSECSADLATADVAAVVAYVGAVKAQ